MRTLPDDPTLASLTPSQRQAIGQAWLGRSASEAGAAENFRLIVRSLREAGADAALVEMAERSIADELEHAELCRQVASRYLAREAPLPEARKARYPTFDGASPELVALLHLVLNCCFNETSATAYLGLCLSQAHGPLVHAALREMLSDDIDHARLGWAVLSSTLAANPALAPVLSGYVLPLTKMNFRTWRVGETPMHEEPAHGCPTGAEVARSIVESMDELVLPGLERAGLDVTVARAWIAADTASRARLGMVAQAT
jgi:hypothetical protein